MKILDEIRVYNGKLNYCELVELVTRINYHVNIQLNQGTGRIPLMYFNRKKAFLHSPPVDNIRKRYLFRDEHIVDRVKENLDIIGKVYDYE